MSKELEIHYNKFCEDKRLTRRHGQVEYITSMKYIHKYLEQLPKNAKILDVGAGTGRYSIALAEEGYDVTAIELVKYNLGILKLKSEAGESSGTGSIMEGEFIEPALSDSFLKIYSSSALALFFENTKNAVKISGIILSLFFNVLAF